jgi:hypothetical protein
MIFGPGLLIYNRLPVSGEWNRFPSAGFSAVFIYLVYLFVSFHEKRLRFLFYSIRHKPLDIISLSDL